MSEIKTGNGVRPAEINQLSRLMDIQRRHHQELYRIGMFDKGLEASTVDKHQRSRMNMLTWASIHLDQDFEGGEKREKLKVKYTTPFNGSGGIIRHFLAFADIAYIFPESDYALDLANGCFNIEEAMVGIRMMKELRMQQQIFKIPDLADSLSSLSAHAQNRPLY